MGWDGKDMTPVILQKKKEKEKKIFFSSDPIPVSFLHRACFRHEKKEGEKKSFLWSTKDIIFFCVHIYRHIFCILILHSWKRHVNKKKEDKFVALKKKRFFF